MNKRISSNVKGINGLTFGQGSQLQVRYIIPLWLRYRARVLLCITRISPFNKKYGNTMAVLDSLFSDVFNIQNGGYSLSTAEFQFDSTFKIDTRAVLFTLWYSRWKNEEVYDAAFVTKKQQKHKALAARDNNLITQLIS